MFTIINIFYSTANLKVVILINNKKLIYLINTRIEIYLIREKKVYEFKLNYTINQYLKLININGNKTIIMGVYENIKININLIIII